MTMTLTRAVRAADLLLAAREGTGLNGLPPDLEPATLAEAYAVQEATLRRIGASGGWKVAPKPHGEPRCAALPAGVFHASGASLTVPPRGYEAEVETAFVFDADLGPDAADDPAQVAAAIGSVHLAIELIASRFIDRKAVSVFTAVADLQGNAAVLLGPAVGDWRELDFAALAPTFAIDGQPVALKPKNTGLPETLSVLGWLAAHAAARDRGLRRGDIIITGARLGPVPLGPAATITAICSGLGEVTARFRS